MVFKIVVGQRKERYEGQHAPEALECCDEYTYDENPTWIEDKLRLHKTNSEFQAVGIIDIEVDGDKIRNILLKPPVLAGEVQE